MTSSNQSADIADSQALRESLNRRLLLVWDDMERKLEDVPFVDNLYNGQATAEDYQRLLKNLHHQVVESAKYIARAISNMGLEHVEIRHRFIPHAGDEHLDDHLLEQDFVACGGDLDELRDEGKNLGSKLLSCFLLHRASQVAPLDMLGALFIIEGLRAQLTPHWGELLQSTLGLKDNQVRFLTHHRRNNVERMKTLNDFFAALPLTQALVESIVRTATTTARLYHCSWTKQASARPPTRRESHTARDKEYVW